MGNIGNNLKHDFYLIKEMLHYSIHKTKTVKENKIKSNTTKILVVREELENKTQIS